MADSTHDERLDPAVLDRLEGLELVARTVVEGLMSGHHRSPLRGSSAEFAQHREYVAGDELRRLDWKVFARSDRLVVKEMFEETTLACHLLVDASESMGFGSLSWSKLDYARWCAAALAHLVIGARDTAGLVVFDDKERSKVPPSTGERQKHAIWRMLEGTRAEGPTGVGDVLNWVAGRLRRRGIVSVFSDFFDDMDKIVEGLRRLAHDGHDAILFQVLDPLELRFQIEHLVRLDGLEGSGTIKVDPKAIRQAYVEEVAAHNRLLAHHAATLGFDYVQLDTRGSLEAALSTYLAHRKARARGGRR
ncbi:MAG: DUF58 domain-containing protein [Planctomycetes bacterium]|nr:DUF58 domain-containing protein [Planctomycetota bacterium]